MARRFIALTAAVAMVVAFSVVASGTALAATRHLVNSTGSRAATARPVLGAPRASCKTWAVVNSDGSLARTGCSKATSEYEGTGEYYVVFTKNVRNCAYEATIGSSAQSGTVAPAFAIVVGDYYSVDGVWIETYNSSGADADEGFHLTVTCGVASGTGCTKWAVVNSDGSLARSGCPGASSASLGTGAYQVLFTKKVTNCAFQATIGSSGSEGTLPAGSATVVGRLDTTDGIWINTYNAAGDLADEGFHLVVTCGTATSPACKTWAVINSNVTVARTGCPGLTVEQNYGTGTWDVFFTTDVEGCAFNATLGLSTFEGTQPAGFIEVVGDADNPEDGVFLETYNSSAALTNYPFHLTVTCG